MTNPKNLFSAPTPSEQVKRYRFWRAAKISAHCSSWFFLLPLAVMLCWKALHQPIPLRIFFLNLSLGSVGGAAVGFVAGYFGPGRFPASGISEIEVNREVGLFKYSARDENFAAWMFRIPWEILMFIKNFLIGAGMSVAAVFCFLFESKSAHPSSEEGS